jgi:hypothetical protein
VIGESDRRQFDEIARALRASDPRFVARAQHAARTDQVTKWLLFGMLQLGSLLVAVGLVAGSAPVWMLGLAVLVLTPVGTEVQRLVERRRRRVTRAAAPGP